MLAAGQGKGDGRYSRSAHTSDDVVCIYVCTCSESLMGMIDLLMLDSKGNAQRSALRDWWHIQGSVLGFR